MRDRKMYLPEDIDIVEDLDKINYDDIIHAGEREPKVLARLQTEALLRSRKTFHEAGIKQERYSWVLFVFGFIQLIIAFFQYTSSIFAPTDLISKIFLFSLPVIMIVHIFVIALKEN